jgi:hypothetical protein
LPSYLDKYNIMVPDEFLGHMKQTSWNAPRRPRFDRKAIVKFFVLSLA